MGLQLFIICVVLLVHHSPIIRPYDAFNSLFLFPATQTHTLPLRLISILPFRSPLNTHHHLNVTQLRMEHKLTQPMPIPLAITVRYYILRSPSLSPKYIQPCLWHIIIQAATMAYL